jgi:hypothetical protein
MPVPITKKAEMLREQAAYFERQGNPNAERASRAAAERMIAQKIKESYAVDPEYWRRQYSQEWPAPTMPVRGCGCDACKDARKSLRRQGLDPETFERLP